MVRRSTGRCAAADSWYTTGWESPGSGASQCSRHFQSVWPRPAGLWCPLVGPGGQPLCILLLSGTGNRHRYSAVMQEPVHPLNTTESCEHSQADRPQRQTAEGRCVMVMEKHFIYLSQGNAFILKTSQLLQCRGTDTSRKHTNQTVYNL